MNRNGPKLCGCWRSRLASATRNPPGHSVSSNYEWDRGRQDAVVTSFVEFNLIRETAGCSLGTPAFDQGHSSSSASITWEGAHYVGDLTLSSPSDLVTYSIAAICIVHHVTENAIEESQTQATMHRATRCRPVRLPFSYPLLNWILSPRPKTGGLA